MKIIQPRFAFLVILLGSLGAFAFAATAGSTHVKGPTPARISMGKKVKLTDYLVPGKTTVFDFTSEFCPTCVATFPRLEKLHATREDLAVVAVDINRPGKKTIDWESPVALQFKIEATPHFKIFGPDGKLVAEGEKAQEKVDAWLK